MEGFIFTSICSALVVSILVVTLAGGKLPFFSLVTILCFSLLFVLAVSASLFF